MSLRERLRTETRLCHDRVDLRFGRYDICAPDGYVAFLAAHGAALAEVRAHIDDTGGHDLRTETQGMLSDIRRDLNLLGCRVAFEDHAPDHVLYRSDAVRYVLLGSRIGLAHLRRAWTKSAKGQVRRADAFLTRKLDARHWNALCSRLSSYPAHGACADAVVGDTKALFDIYARQAASHPPPVTE